MENRKLSSPWSQKGQFQKVKILKESQEEEGRRWTYWTQMKKRIGRMKVQSLRISGTKNDDSFVY